MKEQAPIIRILVTHALKLCKRSESSRSKRIGFFKTFMHKMMVDQGKWEILFDLFDLFGAHHRHVIGIVHIVFHIQWASSKLILL